MSNSIIMVPFPTIVLLAAVVLNTDAANHQVRLNGRNTASYTTANHKCCGAHSTEVTVGLTAVLYDKNTRRSNFGKSFDKRMTELNEHKGDHKGHILASVLGGPAQTWNLAPQAENVNKKVRKNTSILNTWYDCEKWVQKQLEKKSNLPITVKISLIYSNQGGCRPTHWSISASNHGNKSGCRATNIPNGTDRHFGVCQAPRKG